MVREKNVYQDLKAENRNRVFHRIREAGRISSPSLSYELKLSRPTVKQNLDELLGLGYIYENGFEGHTGGRRARTYSVRASARSAIGMDITRNHIMVTAADLCGNLIYEKRVRAPFSLNTEYRKLLGRLVGEAADAARTGAEGILGVGIAVPGLVTEDHQRISYGKILDFTGATADILGEAIPWPCRLYNDADAGGYAEISENSQLRDAFYISLSNNIGGAILIDHKVYKGEGARSGEIGHMTLIPGGRPCYCGKTGCFEAYCNASLLSAHSGGDLELFFAKTAQGDPKCVQVWEEYLDYLAIAVNNIRMLFDCPVILGGYVGACMEPYLDRLRMLALARNPFDRNADFLVACQVKREALAFGAALPFVHEFWKNI